MGASESADRRDDDSEEGEDDDYSDEDERDNSNERGRVRPVATLGPYTQAARPPPSLPATPSPTASAPAIPLPSPPASPLSSSPYARAQHFPLPLATTYPGNANNRSPRGGGGASEPVSRETSKSPRARSDPPLPQSKTPSLGGINVGGGGGRGREEQARTPPPSKGGLGRPPTAINAEKHASLTAAPSSANSSPGGSPRRPPLVPSVFYPARSPPVSPHGGAGAVSPFHTAAGGGRDAVVEFYVVRHAESTNNLQPHLISGRSPSSVLTPVGKQQATALGRFFNECLNLHFDAVYSSPAERTKATAFAICQELGIPEDQIEFSEELQELSHGQWEGKARAEVYTPNMVGRISAQQPDFRAPGGGESQRQVEYRMMEFLNTVALPRCLGAIDGDYKAWFMENGSSTTVGQPIGFSPKAHAIADGEGKVPEERVATTIATGEFQFELGSPEGPVGVRQLAVAESPLSNGSPKQRRSGSGAGGKASGKGATFRVLIVTHAMAIKCLLRGLTGADHHVIQRTTIDNSSVTVIRHMSHRGWSLQKLNETAHLVFARILNNAVEG